MENLSLLSGVFGCIENTVDKRNRTKLETVRMQTDAIIKASRYDAYKTLGTAGIVTLGISAALSGVIVMIIKANQDRQKLTEKGLEELKQELEQELEQK